jgi:hypothetical protein
MPDESPPVPKPDFVFLSSPLRCLCCGHKICVCPPKDSSEMPDAKALQALHNGFKMGLQAAASKCRQFESETMSPQAARAYDNVASAIERMLLDQRLGEFSAEQLATIFEMANKPQTERQRQESTMSFAWGNLAVTSNHPPSKDVFRKIARERYGWTDEDFDAWWAKRAGSR